MEGDAHCNPRMGILYLGGRDAVRGTKAGGSSVVVYNVYNVLGSADLAVGGCVSSLRIASIFPLKEGRSPPNNG